MKNTMKKVLASVLAVLMLSSMVFVIASCDSKKTPDSTTASSSSSDTTKKDEPVVVTYERKDEEEVYASVLGTYEELCEKAKAAATDDERFVLYAQAEAYLLDAAVMSPYLTQGGAYTISRVAPRTVPYVMWGNDDDRLKSIVVSDEFLTKAERAELLEIWAEAVKGEATYDPAGYLTSKGHTIQTAYKTTFSTAPVTLDWLNTSEQSDTEITVNTVDGLVEYNNLGQMTPALAERWTISDDGLTYTFNIRKGVKWYTSEGTEYAEVTAKDFVAGMHHMLDADSGLDWLVEGVIVGIDTYMDGGSFDSVGYKAVDDYTLEITLCAPTSYFMTMLTYSCFLPICEQWFLSHGGAYGEAYADAYASDGYNFGMATDVASQVYCGPFLIQKLNPNSEIVLVKNTNYYKADEVTIESITWIYDNGENPTQTYKDVCDGVYPGMGLTEASGTLALAKADGNFDKYSYISDTTSTSYLVGLNTNRGTFALASGAATSPKTEQQKVDTQTAMLNQNFRKAILHAFDRATFNAVSRGQDLATTAVRNMYTHPEFVQLSSDTTDDKGHTFVAGTFYGEMVQYYCDQYGVKVNVSDGVDGWYNAEAAKEYLSAAVAELGDSVTFPIYLDVVYYSPNANNTAQAQAFKQVVEGALGADKVVINLVETTTSTDFYACGYRASTGEAGNFDIFYGSGWGPDYGDPCTYLDTFLGGGAGYMTKIIGLF